MLRRKSREKESSVYQGRLFLVATFVVRKRYDLSVSLKKKYTAIEKNG